MSSPEGWWRRLRFTMKRSWWSWNPGFRWRWKRKQNMDMRGYPEPISGTGGTHPGEEWHEGNSHELHQQAGRFDGKADRIPGRTVGRFGGSHPHWWENQHGSLPGWDRDYYLICRNTIWEGHLAVLLDVFFSFLRTNYCSWLDFLFIAWFFAIDFV